MTAGGVPVAVLVARLESELETLRIAVHNGHYVTAREAVARAVELAAQVRQEVGR
jgi:hypothetical protein